MTLLLIWRLIQGCSAGGGVIVGRAIIRDLVAGPEAHRMIAQVMMIFAASPAIAPIAGAFLCGVGGWRVVFLATGIFGVVLLLVATLTLPESLPLEHRFPTNLALLLGTYRRVSRDKQFMLLSMSNALNFGALFLYISSAPRFVLDFLHLSIGDFYWLFVPAVVGILVGSALASRCSRRFSHLAVLRAGFGIMMAAGIANAGMNEVLQNPVLPWAVLPITFLAVGIALNQPLLTLLGLERFPKQRGAASSMQAFLSLLVNATVSGVLSPAVSQTPFTLSAAALAISGAAFLFWFAAGRPWERTAHEIAGEETTTAE
jgi:DHA1 family bicyclomycin/chloramphenicol resistance-like MFS transporter